MKVLVTCPPMLGMKQYFVPILESFGIEAYCPDVVQTMTEDELVDLVPKFHGWIIGDDPATARVFEAGKAGNLKAAVKWGIGVDNVDFGACKRLEIPIINTPNMFGPEVADIALGYVIALARETFFIDREIREGNWPKNRGISLAGKKVGVIGQGDIGFNTATRLIACGMDVIGYDPGLTESKDERIKLVQWPDQVDECDFLVFTCSLNDKNRHMLNKDILNKCKDGIRIINVARGPLINEVDLCEAIKNKKVHSAALDVFEEEPLPKNSPLREYPLCIFGSHNGSNTSDAVMKTNERAIDILMEFLNIKKP
jgi:D-3-phosphoglycerate dehydrogenase